MPDLPASPDSQPGDAPPRLARLVGLVDATIASVRTLAVVSLVSAGWMWWWLLGSLTFGSWWGAGLGGAGLLLLATPALVLGAAYWGLEQIRRVPERTVESLQEGRARADAAWELARADADTRTRGIWNVIRALREIWELANASRDTLLGYVALARLANPISLVVMLAAVIGGTGLTVVAAISATIVLLVR